MIFEIGVAILRFVALLFWIGVCIIGIWFMKEGWKDNLFATFFGFLAFCAGLGLTLLSIGYIFEVVGGGI